MARPRDWIDLGRETFRSLDRKRMVDLYSLEWSEAKRRLVADHEEGIAHQRGRVRRELRTWSAVFHGLDLVGLTV